MQTAPPFYLPFNRQQYEVEHAPPSLNLGIRAGAGTGKTATMVQRVLFLLHTVPDLTPGEIAMITFTREATHEMRSRLRQELITRYRLTLNRRYLSLLEQLGEMRITTIHAFARELLQKMGPALGYGPNFRIREFKRERAQILERVADRLLADTHHVGAVLQMPVYRFVEAAMQLWTALENRGLGPAELHSLRPTPSPCMICSVTWIGCEAGSTSGPTATSRWPRPIRPASSSWATSSSRSTGSAAPATRRSMT